MASFQVDGVCYADSLIAVQAMGAREVGKVVQVGATSYVVDVVATTASSITYKFQDVASAGAFIKVATVAPQPCGLLDTADGLIVGWGIAAVWLLTAGVMFLRRGVHE